MNSMEGEHITSEVVRSCRSTKDSVGPRSAVEREKWERTICGVLSKRESFGSGQE